MKLTDTIKLIPGYDPYRDAGDCTFDEKAGQKAIDFFHECITHVKGDLAKQPFILEPWEQAIIANIFGWKRPNGKRRYRKVFIFVPRKNGKTALIAGIVNYVMFCDGEPGAEIYSAAAEAEQAKLVFQQVCGMIHNDEQSAEPVLSSRCRIYQHSVYCEDTMTAYKPISADAGTKHGYNAHLVVMDETHAQPNRDLSDVLKTSQGSRSQPLYIDITTSDFEREGSICNEKHDYAGKVRDGIIDDPYFLPVIYEASKDDDWKDPEVWKKANPNFGISLTEEYIQAACKEAIDSPTFENTFKRLHLNIRTEQDVRWLQMEKWDACGDEIDIEELAGRACYAGLDMSSTTDLTALTLLFPDGDGKITVLPFFWVPNITGHKKERQDGVPYLTWEKQKYVIMTSGDSVDYHAVRAKINALAEIYNIREIAVDRCFAHEIITDLQDQDGFNVVKFGQGYLSMNAPTKELERLVLSGDLNHGGNPVLRWMASNVTVEIDAAENYKPSKKKSTQRIDGIVSTIMALGIAMLQGNGTSIYDEEELMVI